MRVALFGGSFNPPHVAHQMVALYVLETAPVDALWFLPAFEHAFGKPLAPFHDRYRMCELAAAALGGRAQVSDIEARLGGRSRTLKTIERLMQDHAGVTFSLVVGSDLVAEIDGWFGAATLRRLVPFIVVGRTGEPAANDAGVQERQTMAAPVAMPAISSTAIRAAIAAGAAPPATLVPRSVLDYITSRGLYGSPPNPGRTQQHQ